MAWRRSERERLIAARLALDVAWRQAAGERIASGLDALLGEAGAVCVSGYWPLKGEPDLRPWMAAWIGRGGRCALPVVVQKGAPLQFRAWEPGARMTRGIWGIWVPADPTPVEPQVFLAPVVGFDDRCYRLGYGGGYFDRTLAAAGPSAVAIGVGYAQAQLPTIHPLAHDIPLRAIATEQGVVRPPGAVG